VAVRLEPALAAARVGVERAGAQGLRVAIVVLDARFVTVVSLVMDGAYASAPRVAEAKAFTALNFGRPSAATKESVAPENRAALAALEPRLFFAGGGEPVLEAGQAVGAVGVSGATEAEDAALARLVAEALGVD